MAAQHAIRAEKLIITKGHNWVLDTINFTIQPGSLTGLIGSSGSGKTTLMCAIVGVQKLDSGSVAVLDTPAASVELRLVCS